MRRRALFGLVGLVGLALAACMRRSGKSTSILASELPAPLQTRQGGYVVELTADDLFDRGVSLDSLAEPGVYTVIGITTRHCSLSHGIRTGMPDFLASRPDVVYKNVLDFSGTIYFTSRRERRAWQARREAIRTQYRVDFGPKVVIYGPDLQPIVSDRADKGRGYRFLHAWMESPGGSGAP